MTRSFRFIYTMVLVLGLCFVLGFIWFAHLTQTHAQNDQFKTDALVVLTGGGDRVQTGFDLLSQGYAKALFISGVRKHLNARHILRATRQHPDVLPYLHVGNLAKTTQENATETLEWLKTMKYRSFRLITAGYHMPRSLLEFRRVLPNTYIIVPHPVVPKAMKNTHIWSFRVFRLILREYVKFLVVWLTYTLDP